MDSIYCFTIDVDWVADDILEDTLDLFAESRIPCTVFATGKSALKNRYDNELIEWGIHPNFFNKAEDKWEKVLDDLLEVYPAARGVRSHGLFYNSRILRLFMERGLEYDSNIYLRGQKSTSPFKAIPDSDFVRIPYVWEDDIDLNCDDSDIMKSNPPEGVRVFCFHPAHVFLNTENMDRYYAARESLVLGRGEAGDYVNRGKVLGVRDCLRDMIAFVGSNDHRVARLVDVVKNYK